MGLSFVMLALFGFLFARSAPMQAMIDAHATGGHLRSSYGDLFAGLNSWMTIVRWLLYPVLFVLLGLWAGVLERNRPILISVLTILPPLAFAALSFFGAGSLRLYVFQLATYSLVAPAVVKLISAWNRARVAAASA
jgi:hypothetical protein